jgi:hypothetical protein
MYRIKGTPLARAPEGDPRQDGSGGNREQSYDQIAPVRMDVRYGAPVERE